VNFQIYTMYVNRKDLLINALDSVGRYCNKVVILDNSPAQDLVLESFKGEILRPSVPLFCNQSYNLILREAKRRNQEVFFIMHSDALASADVVGKLLTRARELTQAKRRWGILFTNYDVLCLHNTEALQGFSWDPYLPLYYTDADFYYRMKLAGIELIESYLPVEHQEGGSNSMKAETALHAYVETNYPAWRHYYLQKWGGERGQERFTEPFDGHSAEAGVAIG